MYSKSSIFATLGFALVKLRFAGHEACSREPQESSKRAVREILGSIWEPLGAPWGSLGALRALPWAALGSSSASLGSQNGPEHTQCWSPSEISEIVTTPTRELYSRFFMELSWALLVLSWALLGLFWVPLGIMRALLASLGALLGSLGAIQRI